MGYVIKLVSGQYFAGRIGNGVPIANPEASQAQVFTGRLMALLACSQGPANFFDGAIILPEGPQEAPAAAAGSNSPPKAQETQGGAPGREEGGK